MTTKFGSASIMYVYGYVTHTLDAITPVSLLDLGFTLAQLKAADTVLISIEDNDLRWKCNDPDADGYVAVSASDGFPELAATKFEIWGYPNLVNLRLISQTGTCTVVMSLGRFGVAGDAGLAS